MLIRSYSLSWKWTMIWVCLLGPVSAADLQIEYLAPVHKEIVMKWLGARHDWSLATDDHCSCDLDIKKHRSGAFGWKPNPNYHPYYAVGDFNGDRKTDFAVALMKDSKKGPSFAIAVFNGPLDKSNATPAFLREGLNLLRQGFFFGPPTSKPYRLMYGPLTASCARSLEPRGTTYSAVEPDPDC